MTKAELLETVYQLVNELDQAKANTAEECWNNISKELQLLGEDLLKVIRFVYELGVKTGKQVNSLVAKYNPPEIHSVVAEVVEGPEESFPY